MRGRFIQCELCKREIRLESCQLAAHRITVDGKEYVFCCETCAKNYREKKKDNPKI